jgi:predicted MFS family arabinose efflux permease
VVGRIIEAKGETMLLILALLIVLLFFGLGFTAHLLWIVAVVLLVLWLAGMAIGRGESAGRHHFYRW